jgi:FKBP-type peptidyl-prolyl cis-trans isomerase 2
MAVVKEGDTVRIHYKGRLEDGTVFDSTEGGASLEFTVGKGEFLAGLENGIIGMETGATKKGSLNMTGRNCRKGFSPPKDSRCRCTGRTVCL